MVKRSSGHSKMVRNIFESSLHSSSIHCRLGAVVYKLIRHQTAIVSVALTTDGNVAITGTELFQLTFIKYRTVAF